MTIETILVLVLPISFLLFCAGAIGGWVAREYFMNYHDVKVHPEMFDGNGWFNFNIKVLLSPVTLSIA